MDNVKMTLTISLPSGKTVTEKIKSTKETEIEIKKGKNAGQKKKVLKEVTFFRSHEVPCTQVIKMTEEAFREMLHTPAMGFKWKSRPIKKKDVTVMSNRYDEWAMTSKKTRLLLHLRNIADDLGGRVLDFGVFDDPELKESGNVEKKTKA